MMDARPFTAPSGARLSFTALGFGAAPLGNLFTALSEDQAQATLAAAWESGIRYFDTAPLYGLGLSETRLNHFLRSKKRSDYLISTKIGRLLAVSTPETRTGIGKFFDTPSRKEVYDYSHDGVMRSLEASLERLGLDSIDVVYAHDVDVFTHGSKEARDRRIAELMAEKGGGHGALVRLREQGVIKAFGAGINEWEAAETLARRGQFDVFLLAGRYTLLEQEALDSFLPYCVERGVGIVIGGPYNSGILASGPKPGAFYDYDPAPPEVLKRVAALQDVCESHGVRLVEAALRFPFAHPSVVSVIPGARHPDEVATNLRTLGAQIPPALWQALKAEKLIRADAPVPE